MAIEAIEPHGRSVVRSMSGADHYREAVRLLAESEHPLVITGLEPDEMTGDLIAEKFGRDVVVFGEGVEFHDGRLAAAQVHATLAAAAATVEAARLNREGSWRWTATR